jgi:hypothetical protein
MCFQLCLFNSYHISLYGKMNGDNFMSQKCRHLREVCFSHEATFHVSGNPYRHSCRIWQNGNPNATRELKRDSAKMHVWCGFMYVTVIGLYFLSATIATGASASYLDMLELYALPQLPPGAVFRQDGTPSHYSHIVKN